MRRLLALILLATLAGVLPAWADVPLTVPEGGEIIAVVTVQSNVPASIGVPLPPDGIVISFVPESSEATSWETSMSIRADSAPPGQYFFDLVVTTDEGGPLPLERINLTVSATGQQVTTTQAPTTTLAPTTQAPTTTTPPTTQATTAAPTTAEAPTTTEASTQAPTTVAPSTTGAPETTVATTTTDAPTTTVVETTPPTTEAPGSGTGSDGGEPDLEVAGVTLTTTPDVGDQALDADDAGVGSRWAFWLVGLALLAGVAAYVLYVRSRPFVSSVALPVSQVGARSRTERMF